MIMYLNMKEKEREKERIRSKKRLLVLNNGRFEKATLTHLADHITMVKRRNLAVYSHISKEKISVNNNRRNNRSPQISVVVVPPPQPTYFSFVTCSITYCAYQTFPMRHERANLFVFGCEAYTGGKSFLSCRQKLLILFWRRSITPACPLLTSTHTNGRSYRRGCQEKSMIADATLTTIALSHNKRNRCGRALRSHSFLVTALSAKDSSSLSAYKYFCFCF